MPPEDVVAVLEDCSDPLLITHTHADFDSIGSAVALDRLLDGSATLALPEGATRRTQRLLDGVVTVSEPDLAAYDAVVVLDAPSRERIAPIDVADAGSPVVLIDHHEPDDIREIADTAVLDTDAVATAELVYEVATTAGWELSPAAAFPLAAGFLDDTGSLVAAGTDRIDTGVALLAHTEGRVTDLPALLDRTPEFGERVAKAKAVDRARGYRAGEVLVLCSHVGGHQTAAAHALRGAGADVALVFSDRGDRTWVVGRAESDGISEIHLPDDVFHPLAEEFGGDGGGHDGAGVAKLDSSDIEQVEERSIELLERSLGKTLGSF